MSLPDSKPDQYEQKKGTAIARRGLRSSKRSLFFIGNLEPSLLVRRQKRQLQRQSASLNVNVDNEDGEEDEDADADGEHRWWRLNLVWRVRGTDYCGH